MDASLKVTGGFLPPHLPCCTRVKASLYPDKISHHTGGTYALCKQQALQGELPQRNGFSPLLFLDVPGGLMQPPAIHTDGADRPVVVVQPPWHCPAFPALICLLEFLWQVQDGSCPHGNTQGTRSKCALNGLHCIRGAPQRGFAFAIFLIRAAPKILRLSIYGFLPRIIC